MDEKTIEQIRDIIRDELVNQFGFNKFNFRKNIKIFDGRNFQFGRTNGTKIGTATDQKIAFYGTTPVDKPETVSDPAGGANIDSEARTAINALIDRLQELGLIK